MSSRGGPRLDGTPQPRKGKGWLYDALPDSVSCALPEAHSTVTLLARLRGLSTSQPRATAMW